MDFGWSVSNVLCNGLKSVGSPKFNVYVEKWKLNYIIYFKKHAEILKRDKNMFGTNHI